MSLPTADWYFDVISPFAYLQWHQRIRLAGLVTLRPVPVVLGALLGHWEQKGPAEIPPKRLQTYRRCQWHAEHLGIQFRFPPAHPFNPIAALRLAVACGASEAAVDAVFGAAFGEGRDVSDMAVLEEIGRKLGIEDVAATIARPEVKAQLRAAYSAYPPWMPAENYSGARTLPACCWITSKTPLCSPHPRCSACSICPWARSATRPRSRPDSQPCGVVRNCSVAAPIILPE